MSPLAASSSWAVTRMRSWVRMKPQASTSVAAISSATWRGSTLCPTYGAMQAEGRTTIDFTWASSVMTPSASANS
jgi:hypothetical protein